MVIVIRSIRRVEKYTHLKLEKPLKCLNTFLLWLYLYTCLCFKQREYDLYFYVKRDCLLFSVNVKLFFGYFVMREKASYFCVKMFSEEV